MGFSFVISLDCFFLFHLGESKWVLFFCLALHLVLGSFFSFFLFLIFGEGRLVVSKVPLVAFWLAPYIGGS